MSTKVPFPHHWGKDARGYAFSEIPKGQADARQKGLVYKKEAVAMAEDRGSRLAAGPWNRGVTTLTCYSEMASARNRRRASPHSRPREGWMHTCVVLAFGFGLPAPSLLHLDNDTIVCNGVYCRTSGARGRRSGSLNGYACHCCLSVCPSSTCTPPRASARLVPAPWVAPVGAHRFAGHRGRGTGSPRLGPVHGQRGTLTRPHPARD